MLENVKVAQIKKFKKQSAFIFEFCFWEDPSHPVNRSPTHSAGPQTLFFLQPKSIFPKCNYAKCIFAKCTRLACLLSFASLFNNIYMNL